MLSPIWGITMSTAIFRSPVPSCSIEEHSQERLCY
jgi:hypothetical protein